MDNFFGDPYMMWHDGIDPTSVCGLEGAEYDQAEVMLIESMQQGSYWAPMGLREMRSEKAVPVMKEMLNSASGTLLIEIAIALNVIEDTTDYNNYILHVLRENPSPYIRLKAAMKLRDFATPEVIEALFDAVNDVDYLVRNHACESLLAIHGFNPTISEYKEIFKLIIVDWKDKSGTSTKNAAAAYRTAEEMLRALFETKSH
jgi:HEAT repeat protein